MAEEKNNNKSIRPEVIAAIEQANVQMSLQSEKLAAIMNIPSHVSAMNSAMDASAARYSSLISGFDMAGPSKQLAEMFSVMDANAAHVSRMMSGLDLAGTSMRIAGMMSGLDASAAHISRMMSGINVPGLDAKMFAINDFGFKNWPKPSMPVTEKISPSLPEIPKKIKKEKKSVKRRGWRKPKSEFVDVSSLMGYMDSLFETSSTEFVGEQFEVTLEVGGKKFYLKEKHTFKMIRKQLDDPMGKQWN